MGFGLIESLLQRWRSSRMDDSTADIKDYLDVLDGAGDHAAHKRIQDGQYVRCSCGTIAVGRMENG